MHQRLSSILIISSLLSPFVALAAPQIVTAATPRSTILALDLYNPKKVYKDEKKEIENPTSRCVTSATKTLHVKNVARAKASYDDLIKRDLASAERTQLEEAYATYLKELDISWEALAEPYCGFGAFGTSAAIKSYSNGVNRVHANFLKAVATLQKKKVVEDRSVEPDPSQPGDEPELVVLPNVPTPQPKPEEKNEKIDGSLRRGMRSAEVKILQSILAEDPSLGFNATPTTYFGPLTEKALIKFQLKHKLISSSSSPGAGLVGPKTRDVLNNL